MSTTHGETDYNENGSGSGKAEFLKLSQGKHKLRLLTKPHKYPTHKGIKVEGEKGFGRKVPCSAEYTGTGKETKYVSGTCPICDIAEVKLCKKLKPSTQYMYWVLDRGSPETAKVIDVSWSIFSIIKGLSSQEEWGDPQTFDIAISKNPASKGPSDYYLVAPLPNTTLSVAEQNIRDTVDLEYLRNKTAPWTLEGVQKIFDKLIGDGELYIPTDDKVDAKDQPKSNGKKATTVPATELVAATNDVDDAFPNYDQQATN
jgi:hypothetical protein